MANDSVTTIVFATLKASLAFPAIVLKDNIGVNKNYINDLTGALIHEKDLKKTLQYFRENYSKYDPRAWAANNISPVITTDLLNRTIREHSLLNGNKWTADIAIKVNRPELAYWNPGDESKYRHPLNLMD